MQSGRARELFEDVHINKIASTQIVKVGQVIDGIC